LAACIVIWFAGRELCIQNEVSRMKNLQVHGTKPNVAGICKDSPERENQ
jgi:hypothetical protein